MYKVHAYIGNRQVINQRMQHLPGLGHLVRLSQSLMVEVTEIVWCVDEESEEGQRVNIALNRVE